MTLIEFLHPIKSGRQRDIVLATLYYLSRYQSEAAVTVERIRTALKQARVPKAKTMNIAAILAGSGHLVDSPGSDGSRLLWSLTPPGEGEVRKLLPLPAAEPELEHDVASLTTLAERLADETVRGYVEEAIRCLSVDALRAATVFLWAGAIRTLHQAAWAEGATSVNAAIGTHDAKARAVKKLDDFAYIKDATFLKAAFDLGLIDKAERGTLEEALDLRNKCSHPTKYRPRINKARSFIEDVVGIVFK